MATLLLIDDDAAVRQMLESLFSATHECHTADRAEQALEYLQVQKYDVVITDVSMPGLGGVEILQQIKAQRDPTPVIVISGRPDEYRETVLEMGAFAFLGKPFALSAIESSVADAIAQRRQQSSMTLP